MGGTPILAAGAATGAGTGAAAATTIMGDDVTLVTV